VATALKFGFELEEFACDGGLPPDRLQRVLYARGITGILLPPHPVSPDWGDFNWSEFSVVRFGYSCRTPEVQVVTSDEVRNAMLAMRHIRSLRYKRIGLVIGEVTEDRGGLIRAGFYAGHSEAELKQRLPVLIIAHSKALTGPRPELSIWLETYRPEAILTDQAAILKMLNEVGWRVPQDVGVVSCSVPGGDADAGINQNAEEIGRAAVAALISAINEGKRGMPETMSQVLIGGSWVDGASLPGLGTTKS
jgi:DNA-binding LacI/PurR family transcriptional regulator